MDDFNLLFARFLGEEVTIRLKHLRHLWPILHDGSFKDVQGLRRETVARRTPTWEPL
jgi:hypothetical protein